MRKATAAAPVSLFQALRGTNQCVAYVVEREGPWWPQGWLLVDNPVLMVATAAVPGRIVHFAPLGWAIVAPPGRYAVKITTTVRQLPCPWAEDRAAVEQL